MTPVVGKTYAVEHSRKGKFIMRVDSVDKEFASGMVVAGHAKGITKEWRAGDGISVRISLCDFSELAPSEPGVESEVAK